MMHGGKRQHPTTGERLPIPPSPFYLPITQGQIEPGCCDSHWQVQRFRQESFNSDWIWQQRGPVPFLRCHSRR
ncbi:hypothetical protein BDA96_05G205800 [Sorghum bicolor]|uniref:Uncharacterized protein n=2 Tax=Sorghum bicolor TaxID=4558 RepID=A0A921QZT5_SORBI|nr:hypothetical protein BDA96_05G205800 [Sorghum bicolor]KXG28955.1 hypothetical protein SORBI_3005G189300 [Sorghum bicolor]